MIIYGPDFALLEQYILCSEVDLHNKAPHRTAIPLCSIAAGGLNCKHIANARELPRIYEVLDREGLGQMLICTPAEFLSGDSDDEETTDS